MSRLEDFDIEVCSRQPSEQSVDFGCAPSLLPLFHGQFAEFIIFNQRAQLAPHLPFPVGCPTWDIQGTASLSPTISDSPMTLLLCTYDGLPDQPHISCFCVSPSLILISTQGVKFLKVPQGDEASVAEGKGTSVVKKSIANESTGGDAGEIALFRIGRVLLPRAGFPLQIFKHKTTTQSMFVKESKRTGTVGVIFTAEGSNGSFAEYGCEAQINSLTHLDDGRLIVECTGTRRFKVEYLTQAEPYLRAQVAFDDDAALLAPDSAVSCEMEVWKMLQEVRAFVPRSNNQSVTTDLAPTTPFEMRRGLNLSSDPARRSSGCVSRSGTRGIYAPVLLDPFDPERNSIFDSTEGRNRAGIEKEIHCI